MKSTDACVHYTHKYLYIYIYIPPSNHPFHNPQEPPPRPTKLQAERPAPSRRKAPRPVAAVARLARLGLGCALFFNVFLERGFGQGLWHVLGFGASRFPHHKAQLEPGDAGAWGF